MYIDDYGRVQPDPNRFPSSGTSNGFKKLAAYAHANGLLFGIHTSQPNCQHTAQPASEQNASTTDHSILRLLVVGCAVRGISHAAITKRTPVVGSNYTADEVYDVNNQCGWTPGSGQTTFYSLNMVHTTQLCTAQPTIMRCPFPDRLRCSCVCTALLLC